MKWLTFLLAISPALGSILPRAEPPVPFTVLDEDSKVKDRYLVSLKSGHTLSDHWKAIGKDLSKDGKDFQYMEAINVYGVTLSDADIVHSAVRSDTEVEVVEMDQYVDLSELEADQGAEVNDGPRAANQKRWEKILYQDEAWWHAAQISAGKKNDYSKGDWPYPYEVMDEPLAGTGVDIYILDTGVMIEHHDFTGRAKNFKDLKPTDKSPYVDEAMKDTHGHGTHVAGIAAGGYDGAAPNANIINVKVLGDDASNEKISRAVNDVAAEHDKKKSSKPSGWMGSVINMSIKTAPSNALKKAVNNAKGKGVAIAASAGNKNLDSKQGPCVFDSVICVAASDKAYKKASFSNYGAAVDVIAPGKYILSAGLGGGSVHKSGTSMASPFVAGIMANFLSYEGKTLYGDAGQTYKRLKANMIKDIVTGFPYKFIFWPTTVNLFANNGINNPDRRSLDPYAGIPKDELKGTCKIKMDEIWTCGDAASNLYARLTITDANGKEVYTTKQSTSTPGVPINDNSPLGLQEPGMKSKLVVVGEHSNDYVQFTYGSDASFIATAEDAGKANVNGQCSLKGDNWNTEGPQGCPNAMAETRSFECEYECEDVDS